MTKAVTGDFGRKLFITDGGRPIRVDRDFEQILPVFLTFDEHKHHPHMDMWAWDTADKIAQAMKEAE